MKLGQILAIGGSGEIHRLPRQQNQAAHHTALAAVQS
jgi:hypothetical protein